MKIWKQNFTVMAIAAIIALTLSACFSEWEEETGNLIINLGGGSGRSAMPSWPPKDILLNYKIELSGNGDPITILAQDGETISATVSVGHWNVYVEAYFEGDLYAKSSGDDYVDVKAKQNNPVSIQMHKAFADSLDRIEAVYDSSKTNVYTFTLLESLKDHLTVTAFYKDKNFRTLYADEYTLSGTLTAGTSTVTVSHTDGGVTKRDTFDVAVSSATLSGIAVVFEQNAAAIYTSTPLNKLKQYLTVKATYSNGDEEIQETLSSHEYTLGGTLTAGKPAITVEYGDKSATFNPTVTAVALVRIEAHYNNTEIIYASTPLENLKTYLTVMAFYNDGNEDTLSAHEYTLTGPLIVGTSIITVNFGGQSDIFDLTVKAALSKILVVYDNENGVTVYTSTSLKDYLTVTALYDDGTSRSPLDAEEYTLSELTAGAPTITVSYTEGPVTKTNSFYIMNVIAAIPTGITVQYNGIGAGTNQTINDLKADLTVMAAYNDGSPTKTLDAGEYTLTGSIGYTGNRSITVSHTYYGATTSSSFNVYVYSGFYTVSDEASWNTAANGSRGGGSYFINITNDFSRAGDRYYTFDDISITNKNVTINGGNHTITMTGAGSLLSIDSNQTVTVSNLNLVGNNVNNVNNYALVEVRDWFGVNNSAALTMNNCTVKDNTSSGFGVSVGDGTFTMNGGEISGNSGSGVSVAGGTFTMNGGEISGNTRFGVWVAQGFETPGTFIMSSGKISGNAAGGVWVAGDDDPALRSTFTMNGGEISGNTASSDGGGVYVRGTFTMNDGEISGNTAVSGGGVYVVGAVFTSTGGSDYALFTMKGGKVSGNTATGTGSISGGGGVYIQFGTFHMQGGLISGNAANQGGGVFNYNNRGPNLVTSNFYILKGTVYGSDERGNDENGNPLANTATTEGAALYVVDNGNWTSLTTTENTIHYQ